MGIWCAATLLSSDDAVAHMICLSVTTGIMAGGAARAYGRQWIFQLQVALCFGPTVIALGVAWHTLLHGDVSRERRVRYGSHAISANLHKIFMQALVAREREAALAGPVRHRPQQHAARPLHVRRRRAPRGHESSFQRDDEPFRRSHASRRECRRHHLRLRRRRIDLGCKRKDDPLGNREFAGQGYHHHRSRRRHDPVAVMDISTDGRRWRRRAAGRHHRTAQRGSQNHAIWRVTTS